MKRVILFIFIISIFSWPFSAAAQQHAPKIPFQLKEYRKKLKLTDEQVNKITQLLKELRKEKSQIDSLKLLPQKDRRLAKQKIGREFEKRLKIILTPEQLKKYKEIYLNNAIDKQLAVMEIKVNLTAEQSKAIRPLILKTFMDISEIRESEEYSKREKTEKIVATLKELDSKIENLLQEEQLQAYEEYKKERKAKLRRTFFER